MKKIKLWLIISLGLLSSIHARAYDFDYFKKADFELDGFGYSFTEDSTSVEIFNCTLKSKTDISIPSKISYNKKEYPVTSIGSGAFYEFKHMENVEIPNSIISIKYGAFRWSGLKSVIIPESVKNIEGWAFEGCKYLSSVEISSSVSSINNEAFLRCTSLTSIKVDPKNEVFDSRDNCNAVIESKTNTLVIAGPASTIPSSVTCIGDYAFQEMTFESFKIPKSIISIGEGAFQDCYSLKSIEFPNTLQSIGKKAFSYCPLVSVNIPKNVSHIGDGAFGGCGSLDKITVDSENAYYDTRDNCNALIETKSNKLIKGSNTTIIPNTIKEIGNNAFSGCEAITFIKIPNSVTTIGASAFSNCSALKNIELSDNLTSIEESLFRDCRSLTSINIPNSVKSIGNAAFHSCESLESVENAKSVTSMGDFCFAHCVKLKSLTIPYGVESLEPHTFVYSDSLASITFPNLTTAYNSYGVVIWFVNGENAELTVDDSDVFTIDNNGFIHFHKRGVAVVSCSHDGIPFRQCKFIVGGYPVTIESTGYATFSAPSPYEIPGSLEVGTVKVENNQANVTFSSPNSCYSSDDAVILRGNPGDYFVSTPEFPPTSLEKCPDNELKPAYCNDTIQSAPGNELFVLAEGAKGLGFYYQMGCPGGSCIFDMQGKAYLEIPKAKGCSNGLRLVENDVTSIELVNVENADDEIYTLTGVRMNQPANQLSKGVYIINGKKVLIK